MEVKVGDCVEVKHLGDDATHLLQLKALWSEPTQTRSRMQALGQYFYRAEVAMIRCSTLHFSQTVTPFWHMYLVDHLACCDHLPSPSHSTTGAGLWPLLCSSLHIHSTVWLGNMTVQLGNRIIVTGLLQQDHAGKITWVSVVRRIHGYKQSFQSMRCSVQTRRRQ